MIKALSPAPKKSLDLKIFRVMVPTEPMISLRGHPVIKEKEIAGSVIDTRR